jgi:hypothetical protein
MILNIIEAILGFVFENLIITFVCYVLSPIVWLICLPFILVIALFKRGSYGLAVVDLLGSVNSLWRWGIGLRN